jgi:CHAT domain-containing protein
MSAECGLVAVGRRFTCSVVVTLLLTVYSVPMASSPAQGAPLPQQSESALVQQAQALRAEGTRLGQQGDVPGALDRLTQALALYRQAEARVEESLTMSGIAALYDAIGQHQQALEHFQQALALARSGGMPPALESAILSSLLALYRIQGEYERADATEQELYRIIGTARIPAGGGTTDRDSAALGRQPSVQPDPLDFWRQTLTVSRSVGRTSAEATPLAGIGDTYASRGEYELALDYLQQALTVHQEFGNRMAEGPVLDSIGQAHAARGDLRAALRAYYEAMAAREDVRTAARLEEFKTTLAAQAAGLYERTALLHLRLGQPAEAFHVAERGRARAFLDQLGNTPLSTARAAQPELLAQERSAQEIAAVDDELRQERAMPPGQQNAARVTALATQLAARQAEYAQVQIQLKLADPEAASLVSVDPLTLSQLQQVLAPDTTLLYYLVTPDRTVAFVVRREAFDTVELPIGAQELSEAITRLRAFAHPDDAPAILGSLSARLLDPLASQLTTPVLAVVPHGILYYLPFAALRNGSRYLGETHILHHLPSASVLPYVQAKRKSTAGNLLAMAQSQPRGLPPLRFADVEAAAIAQFYGIDPLIGGAATETAFRARASTAGIIHLAAHGELNERAPLFSRIFLGADSQSDGSLTVQDVYGLDLAQADLVVLSACETQLGAQSQGGDIVGLNRAFIYAGAPSVIASLWSVNDQATSVLMAAFYRHLRAGASKAEALQAAQADTRAVYPHPYLWAAFVLTGDPGLRSRG